MASNWQIWSSGLEEWDAIAAPPGIILEFRYVKWHAGVKFEIYNDELGRWFRRRVTD